MLGHLGAALERDETDECRDDARVGEEHDLERSTSRGGAESSGLPKGGEVEQEGDGGSGSPVRTRCDIAQVRHFD